MYMLFLLFNILSVIIYSFWWSIYLFDIALHPIDLYEQNIRSGDTMPNDEKQIMIKATPIWLDGRWTDPKMSVYF